MMKRLIVVIFLFAGAALAQDVKIGKVERQGETTAKDVAELQRWRTNEPFKPQG